MSQPVINNAAATQGQHEGYPPPNSNFHVYLACYKMVNPHPLKTMRSVIIYDASVFGLNLLVLLIFYLSTPNISIFDTIFQLLIMALILVATLLTLKGLEPAIKMKRLHQRLCSYNIARVIYYILLTINALGNIFSFFYTDSNLLPVWIKVWGIILLVLCAIGLLLQPMMYTITRQYTSPGPFIAGQPGYNYGTYAQPGQPNYRLPPGWNSTQGQPYQAQPPIMMQEINLRNPQSQPQSNAGLPGFTQQPAPTQFAAFQGRGTSIGNGNPSPKETASIKNSPPN